MKKISKIFFGLGTILIILSIFFLINDLNEDKLAGSTSKKVLGIIENDLDNNDNSNKNYVDDTILIDGYNYIGIIEIPSINLKLPIISTFDYDRLKIAPCIYYGSIETNDLVICGHSYKNHFRYLKELKSGDIITITDMNSNTYYYEVALVEILKPTEVLEMIESSFDLTLYTCSYGALKRITVRCNRIYDYV